MERAEWAAAVWSAAVFFVSILPGDAVSGVSVVPDKAAHALMFGPLGVCLCLAGRVPAWAASVWLVCLAGATELVQRYVPGRHAEWADFLCDVAGGVAGWACAWGMVRRWRARERKNRVKATTVLKDESDES